MSTRLSAASQTPRLALHDLQRAQHDRAIDAERSLRTQATLDVGVRLIHAEIDSVGSGQRRREGGEPVGGVEEG